MFDAYLLPALFADLKRQFHLKRERIIWLGEEQKCVQIAMCWCFRVYWTVLHNLLIRFYNHLVDLYYTNDCHLYCGCCCIYCVWLRRHCCCCSKCKQNNDTRNANQSKTTDGNDELKELQYKHDYVIVDEIDANYIEIEHRKIETETYYRTIDRATAERELAEREDGACLVRPFKEMDISIKYIVSVYAMHQYFHLFIRQIDGKQRFCIGQAKPYEQYFATPADIVEFYSAQPLLCTNKQTSLCLVLKPIAS